MNVQQTSRMLALPTALLLALAATPTGTAQELPSFEYCPTPDPEAWAMACAKVFPTAALHAMVDFSNSERVCVFNDICIDVPDPRTVPHYTTIYTYSLQAQAMPDNAREDVCELSGLLCDPFEPVVMVRGASLQPTGLLTGIVVESDGESHYFGFSD